MVGTNSASARNKGAGQSPYGGHGRARRCDSLFATRYPPFAPFSPAAAEHLDIQIADLLAQRVAVDPEQIGGADLVAAGGGERHRQERMLDLPQNAVIEPGRRQLVAESGEVRRKMPLDRGGQPLLRARLVVGR